MKRSLKQQIGDLNVLWAEKEWDIAEVKGSNIDPDLKYHHLNDLQFEQIQIEEEIDRLEHELKMLPLRVMLYGFTIFALGLLIYRLMY